MLKLHSSKMAQKEALLSLGFRISDENIETTVKKLFNFAEENFMKEFKENKFSIEDTLDSKKAVEITQLYYSFFESENLLYLFSSRTILSSIFFRKYREEIEKIIKDYIASDELTQKELKRLDRAFASKLFSYRSRTIFYTNSSIYQSDREKYSGKDVETIQLTIDKAIFSLKLITLSRLNSYNELKNDNQAKIDLDIFDRAGDNLSPEYRYEFYQKIIDQTEEEISNYPISKYLLPFQEARELFIILFNEMDKRIFPNDFITLV